MDIDLSALRAIERDKEIPLEYLLKALEDALLNAYLKTDGAKPGARVVLDRKLGTVAVMVPDLNEDGEQVGEYDDTPADFGRVAAATARQVIFQRLREHEDEQKYGRFAASEGDILTGVIQQDRDTRSVRVDLGQIEAIMPLAEQAPGEETLLGAAGDEVPPGGIVAGSFSQEFPGADPYAGMPADEIGLPPLSAAEQEAVAREADRLADDPDARRNL